MNVSVDSILAAVLDKFIFAPISLNTPRLVENAIHTSFPGIFSVVCNIDDYCRLTVQLNFDNEEEKLIWVLKYGHHGNNK